MHERMIDIFHLNTGMTGTELLTDKSNRDGSPVRRSRPDVPKKMLDPVGVPIEDKLVTHELRKSTSNKKSIGTPIKMLIAQEMSNEMETKEKSPSIVARLMGLDALPAQQPIPLSKRIIPEDYKHDSYSLGGTIHGYQHQEDGHFDRAKWHDINPSQFHVNEQKEYKDVYEVWQQPSRTNRFRDQPLSKGIYNENPKENRMALVHQKFMEAKRLATDQKLFQSKEFQDALEVLSSNRDLFLKFLEEPNSLSSKHLHEFQTAPPTSQTKRITVLKPSKKVETRSGNELKKHHQTVEDQFYKDKLNGTPDFVYPKAENLSQPTRIVVLKPSPGKKAVMTSLTLSPGQLERRDICEELGNDEIRGSREVAKEITRQMRESLSSNRRDETLLSSVLSNGYIGDDSSFNRSENEFMEDEGGNFSDSVIVTPTSCHSWDRFDCSYSHSSFSRASYSPESSVIREAKKRLSERWAMVASNGTTQEQRQVQRSSSTLGEMFAIPEIKKGEGNGGGLNVSSSRSCGREQNLRVPAPCLSISGNEDESGEVYSPRNLLRSKSVPVSSSAYENIGLNVQVSESQDGKSIAPKDVTRSKSGKSSFKGKVSSLFFSRNRKPSREKYVPSPLVDLSASVQSINVEYVGKRNDDLFQCVLNSIPGTSHNYDELICKNSSLPTSKHDRAKQDILSAKTASALEKLRAFENASEDQDQPTPFSVLEAPFEDDVKNSYSQSSEGAKLECRQLISRSPPIESVVRSLSWDDARSEIKVSSPLKLSKVLSRADNDGEQQFLFVRSLLSTAGIGDQNSDTALAWWHSLESPLDPLLLEKLLEEHKEEDSKWRERRSNQRLLFDCVNAALLDIGRSNVVDAYPRVRACRVTCSGMAGSASVKEEVWVRIREWLRSEEKWAPGGRSDNSSLAVDGVLRKEVAGRGWEEMMGLEMDEVGKGIEGQVLQELVGEALADLIPGWR